MEKRTSSFISWEELRDIDLVGFLDSIGHQPARVRRQSYWYRSPLRHEKTPSFKVNRRLNRWYDFGTGKGGSIIDFCLEYYQADFREIVQLLSSQISLPSGPVVLKTEQEKSPIEVTRVARLSSAALTGYLNKRGIPVPIADRYVKEIRYCLYDRSFFAIGFQNDAGGYEIRSEFFKGSSSPKAATMIINGFDTLSVFEGFMDLLSYLVLLPEMNWPQTDYLVLNSLSLVDLSLEKMLSYPQVSLYLDNDPAGQKATRYLLGTIPAVSDSSVRYKSFQDLNEFLVSKQPSLKRSRRMRR